MYYHPYSNALVFLIKCVHFSGIIARSVPVRSIVYVVGAGPSAVYIVRSSHEIYHLSFKHCTSCKWELQRMDNGKDGWASGISLFD